MKLFLHYFKNNGTIYIQNIYIHIYVCIKTEEWTSANHSFRPLVTAFQNAMRSMKSKNDKKPSSSSSSSSGALVKEKESTHSIDKEEEDTGLDLNFQGKLDAVAGGLSESSGLILGGDVGGTGGLGDSLPLYWTAHFLVINPSTSTSSSNVPKDGFVLLKMKCDCVNIGCFDDEVKGKSLK